MSMKELWKELNLVNRAIVFFQFLFAVTMLTHMFDFYTRLVVNRTIAASHGVFLNSEVCLNEAVMVSSNKVRDCNESKEWLSVWPAARSLNDVLCQYKMWNEGEFQLGLVWIGKALFFAMVLMIALFTYQFRYIKKKIDDRQHALPTVKGIKNA